MDAVNVELYSNLRPCSTVDEGYLIVGISKSKDGPFYVFKKEHRHQACHPLLVVKLGEGSIKNSRNIRIKFSGSLVKVYIDISNAYSPTIRFKF